jgi:hypothetical protein
LFHFLRGTPNGIEHYSECIKLCLFTRDEMTWELESAGHLLEEHGLAKDIFDAIADLLEERRLLLRSGDRGRDHHRGAEFDQERDPEPRP